MVTLTLNNKGETSIALIFSIVITVIAIVLAILLIPTHNQENTFACKLYDQLSYFGVKPPLKCVKSLDAEGIKYSPLSITTFQDGNSEELLKFGPFNEEENISFQVPANSIISSATLSIIPGSKSIKWLFKNVHGHSVKVVQESFDNNVTLKLVVPYQSEITKFYILINLNETAPLTILINNKTTFNSVKEKRIGVVLNTTLSNQELMCGSENCSENVSIKTKSKGLRIEKISVVFIPRLNSIDTDDDIKMVRKNNQIILNFTNFAIKQLKLAKGEDCENNYCTINIPITSQNITLLAKNLSIVGKFYNVEEDLLLEVKKCLIYSQDLSNTRICAQLSIPKSYKFKNNLTEKDFISFVKKKGYCGLINDEKYGCGKGTNILFKENITSPTNVLIKYDNYLDKVVIE